MGKQQYKRLSIEFPAEEYIHLKMACAKEEVSLKDFVTTAVIMYLENYEDQLIAKTLEQELTEENLKNAISLDQLKAELGFDEKEI